MAAKSAFRRVGPGNSPSHEQDATPSPHSRTSNSTPSSSSPPHFSSSSSPPASSSSSPHPSQSPPRHPPATSSSSSSSATTTAAVVDNSSVNPTNAPQATTMRAAEPLAPQSALTFLNSSLLTLAAPAPEPPVGDPQTRVAREASESSPSESQPNNQDPSEEDLPPLMSALTRGVSSANSVLSSDIQQELGALPPMRPQLTVISCGNFNFVLLQAYLSFL